MGKLFRFPFTSVSEVLQMGGITRRTNFTNINFVEQMKYICIHVPDEHGFLQHDLINLTNLAN